MLQGLECNLKTLFYLQQLLLTLWLADCVVNTNHWVATMVSNTDTINAIECNATQCKSSNLHTSCQSLLNALWSFFLFHRALNVLRSRFRVNFDLYFCKGLKIFEWESGVDKWQAGIPVIMSNETDTSSWTHLQKCIKIQFLLFTIFIFYNIYNLQFIMSNETDTSSWALLQKVSKYNFFFCFLK